ncbi:MAG: SMP-30/gluconolactonase/LRE family protein [Thermomicrobiales bacterium]
MTSEHPAVPTIELDSAPEVVVDLPCQTGEGPIWDDRRHVVFWLDIPPGRLYRYDPATGANDLVYQHDAMIGGTTLQDDGSMLLFCSRGAILHLDPDSGKTRIVVDSIEAEHDSRFNDVEAAPDGGVFCGTMASKDHKARLYRLAPDGSLTLLFDDLGLSNGIGYSPDRRTMYHVDTNTRITWALDYDEQTGAISNRRALIENPSGEGYPDGMTVDAQGDLWIARWDGRSLYRYTPEGECTGRVRFPVRKVSSVAFGGEDFADAYVSTAAPDGRSEDEGELAGSLFKVRLPATGKPPFRSRVGL